jgi:uridine kinase
VGIDGIDAAGKTTFADELILYLLEHGRRVIRASIDGFHNPRAIRYRRGDLSPEGYYHDSFNLEALRTYLLEPLGSHGDGMYTTKTFDFKNDRAEIIEWEQASPADILLLDGVFLFRPELLPYWDVRIYLDISFETSLTRALGRDGDLFGEPSQINQRYRDRYIPGQQIYLRQVDPASKADIVIDNNDPDRPNIVRMERRV